MENIYFVYKKDFRTNEFNTTVSQTVKLYAQWHSDSGQVFVDDSYACLTMSLACYRN